MRKPRTKADTARHIIEVDININAIAHREALRLDMTMKEYYSTIIIEHILSIGTVNDKGELE